MPSALKYIGCSHRANNYDMKHLILSPYELLAQCTVRLSIAGKQGYGTGFFVAPGLILTCAHVVHDARQNHIDVAVNQWNQQYQAQVIASPERHDLALLRTDLTEHPCVYLGRDALPFDQLYTYGYSDDHSDGDPATFNLEGWSGSAQEQLKFKLGQVRPGMSGSPILNLRTGRVCGIINLSRDRSSDLGGRGIPTTVILKMFVELEAQQQFFHQQDQLWLDIFDRRRFSQEVLQPTWEAHERDNTPRRGRADWYEIPHVDHVYGRGREYETLQQWIVQNACRMISITGSGGIGKTVLVAKATEDIKEHFSFVFWRTLQNAPLLETILEKCILFLSAQRITDLPKDIDGQISLLIQFLQEQSCLLVLDNVETILQSGDSAGKFREGYEGYAQLLQRIGMSQHQSCLLLTGREKPQEVRRLEDKEGPVRSLQLFGLQQVSVKELLKDKDLYGSEEDWERLIRFYSGNPLALKIVVESIHDIFSGNIARFLESAEMVFGDLQKLLQQQFQRLSKQEQACMYWLAIEREPISVDSLGQKLALNVSKGQLFDTLGSLLRRSLVERDLTGHFSLQPMVLEYVTDRLVAKVVDEMSKERIGLLGQHALIEAQAKDYIRSSQTRLILSPIIERLRQQFSQEECEKKVQRMLAKLHQNRSAGYVYAAGNLMNFLVHLNCDLRGYDFSQLTVRNADLRNVMLPDVNFLRADLSATVFAELFGGIYSVALSAHTHLLAAGMASGDILVWEAESGLPLLTCQGHTDSVKAVAFNPDGTLLASAAEDESVRIWEARTGVTLHVLRGPTRKVQSVAFSPDGKMLASGGSNETIELWDVDSGACLRILPSHGHTHGVRSVAYSPDGKLLASSSDDKSVLIWEVSTGRMLQALRGHKGRVWAVAFAPAGNIIASGSEDMSVRVWDISTGACLRILQGHSADVKSVAFGRDGMVLASGSEDMAIRLWEANTGYCLRVMKEHTDGIWSVAFSDDGKVIGSGSDDQSIRLWDVSTGHCLKVLQGRTNSVRALTFSPDGSVLASGGDDQFVRLWHVPTGQPLKTLRGHNKQINMISFNSDGSMLASSSGDMNARLWQVQSGQCLKVLQGRLHTDWFIATTTRGNIIAQTQDDPDRPLWKVHIDLENRPPKKRLVGPNMGLTAYAYSADGRLLASSYLDMSVRLWDAYTGVSFHTLRGHNHWVWAIAFSQDGSILASGDEGGVIKLWDTQTGACLLTLLSERQYERMNITEAKGITDMQISTLKLLGAITDKRPIATV